MSEILKTKENIDLFPQMEIILSIKLIDYFHPTDIEQNIQEICKKMLNQLKEAKQSKNYMHFFLYLNQELDFENDLIERMDEFKTKVLAFLEETNTYIRECMESISENTKFEKKENNEKLRELNRVLSNLQENSDKYRIIEAIKTMLAPEDLKNISECLLNYCLDITKFLLNSLNKGLRDDFLGLFKQNKNAKLDNFYLYLKLLLSENSDVSGFTLENQSVFRANINQKIRNTKQLKTPKDLEEFKDLNTFNSAQEHNKMFRKYFLFLKEVADSSVTQIIAEALDGYILQSKKENE